MTLRDIYYFFFYMKKKSELVFVSRPISCRQKLCCGWRGCQVSSVMLLTYLTKNKKKKNWNKERKKRTMYGMFGKRYKVNNFNKKDYRGLGLFNPGIAKIDTNAV